MHLRRLSIIIPVRRWLKVVDNLEATWWFVRRWYPEVERGQ
jgi:hypothetical protein